MRRVRVRGEVEDAPTEVDHVISLLRRNHNFAIVIIACAQSQLGNGAAYVALLLVAYQRLHSGWAVALVLLSDFLPGIVLAPLFGALADRLPRRRLVVGGDLCRVVAFLGIALVSSFAATVVLALLAGVGTAAFRPAAASALPAMVERDDRSRAVAWWSLCADGGVMLGPAITALLLLFFAPTLVLLLNAATFAVSAALLSRAELGRANPDAQRDATRPHLRAQLRAGVAAIRGLPGVSIILVAGALATLAAALMNPAEPLLAIGPLHGGGSAYAALVSCYGIGMVGGTLVNSRLSSDVSVLRKRWLSGMALQAAGLVGSALAPDVAVASLTFLLTGWGNAFIAGPEMRMLQELVPEGLLGRVLGLYDVLGNTAYAAAFVSAGALLSSLGPRAVLIVGAALVVLVLVGAAARLGLIAGAGAAARLSSNRPGAVESALT